MQNSEFRRRLQLLLQSKPLPFGLIGYRGPNDKTISKITIGIMVSKESESFIKSWTGDDIANNPSVAAEIGKLFKENCIQNVVIAEKVLGCPHDEGIDFEIGNDCPHCPFWADKQHK